MGEKFEQYCQQTTEIFMAMPEMPIISELEGREITGFSTASESSDIIIANLSSDEKLALISELMADEIEIDMDSIGIEIDVGHNARHSFEKILDVILSHTIATAILKNPAVAEREQSNMDIHDQLFELGN